MKELTLEQKKSMRDRLETMILASGLSGNRYATERLGFASPSKLSHILNGWDKDGLVGQNTWDTISKHIDAETRYKLVKTDNLKTVFNTCERAYQLRKNLVVIGEGGYGKTTALESYKKNAEANGRKVVYYNAHKHKTRKQFITGLMYALECYEIGTIPDQLTAITKKVRNSDILLIIDEVSSLERYNVVIIKDVMDALKDLCGIVFAGTPYFINNLNDGANKNRHLFSETRRRLFMLPEILKAPTEAEAEEIFKLNGVSGESLAIVMGKNQRMITHSYKAKNNYQSIKDCIDMLNMLDITADFENIQL